MPEDQNHHPRLLMLHHADGRIEGRAKYHKLLFNYSDEEADETQLDFVGEDFGPYEPGLTRAMRRHVDLGLVDVDDSEEPHIVAETEKGRRYLSGYERAKLRLDATFQKTREKIMQTINEHGDKSANEMVQQENIQEAKQEPFRKKLE